jgi:hypothetical protein
VGDLVDPLATHSEQRRDLCNAKNFHALNVFVTMSRVTHPLDVASIVQRCVDRREDRRRQGYVAKQAAADEHAQA